MSAIVFVKLRAVCVNFLDAAITDALNALNRLPCETEQTAIAVDFRSQQCINGAAGKAVGTPDTGPNLGPHGAAIGFPLVNG